MSLNRSQSVPLSAGAVITFLHIVHLYGQAEDMSKWPTDQLIVAWVFIGIWVYLMRTKKKSN